MPSGATELVELMLKYGYPVVPVLIGLMVAAVVLAWLIRADPFGFVRSLLNRKKQRLEHIRSQDYLCNDTKKLAELELKQLALYQLTGVFNHRLQPVAVKFCSRFNHRARYLTAWRSWLNEQNGNIQFEQKWYRYAWRGFVYVNLPLSLGMVLAISGILGWKSGIEYIAPMILLNTIMWWGPWIMFSSVPTPQMTRALETELAEYNTPNPASE